MPDFSAPEHFITADGSSTLILPGINEQYHSKNGAIQESETVYIKNGFNYLKGNHLQILEIGFGTGLNCLLTFASSIKRKSHVHVNYIAVEPFPISSALLEKLNYKSLIQSPNIEYVVQQIHAIAPNEKNFITPYFALTIDRSTLQDYVGEEAFFDCIYFDAFGPNVQPEMWTSEVFKKMHRLLKKDGILVTYCAKGEVKRTLKSAGFKLEGLAGPPGKREVTRASKCI